MSENIFDETKDYSFLTNVLKELFLSDYGDSASLAYYSMFLMAKTLLEKKNLKLKHMMG